MLTLIDRCGASQDTIREVEEPLVCGWGGEDSIESSFRR